MNTLDTTIIYPVIILESTAISSKINAKIRNILLEGEGAGSVHAVEIMDPCYLPHAIRSQEPTYALRYTRAFLASYLKEAFMRKWKS